MLTTIEAIIKDGRIIPTESVELSEGARALVTVLDAEDRDFWVIASETSLDGI